MTGNGTGRVAGKVALVTGAASGIGRATAILLAREGAKVAIADIDEAGGNAVAGEIGDNAIYLQHDVSREADWQRVLAATREAFGGLNILVNNAGITTYNNVEEASLEEWRRVHEVDLDGVFLGCKHAISVIADSGGGSIVNLSSVAGNVASYNMPAYNSAKAAVRHLTKSVALHCARQGYNIRCNSVHPGSVDTPILDQHKQRFGEKEAIERLSRVFPLGRIGRPDEIAYGILYLASDESSFTTGSELIIDGGFTAR